jgi:uncharacterized cofD-like protein
MKKVTVLGGGTGSFVVLSGLKNDAALDLGAIVTMSDNGGSTGRLRDQLGVLPAGDLRQCLVALSQAPEVWRKLFTYRFETGDLKGHNFGNILVSALEKVSDNYNEVIEEVHRVMSVKGTVIPVTLQKTDLHVAYESGRTIEGETLLDESSIDGSRIKKAQLVPEVVINPQARQRILDSDYIIAGPGDLYSSIISIALVNGVKEAMAHTKAKIIFIMNLMTKSSQTNHYHAADHIHDFEAYFGRKPDIVLVNTGEIPAKLVTHYEAVGDTPVENDLHRDNFSGTIFSRDVISRVSHEDATQALAASFAHSIVRHDPEKLAEALHEILYA